MSVAMPQIDSQLWSSRSIKLRVRGPEGVQCIRTGKPFALIGADRRADVVLTHAGMPPCGIYLHATEDGIYCLGLRPPPGGKSAPRGWLGANLGVQFGPYRIKAEFDDDGPPLAVPTRAPVSKPRIGDRTPELQITCPKPTHVDGSRIVTRQFTLVGASVSDGLRIEHHSLSSLHCVLYFDGVEVWIIDLLSGAGVQVEGNDIAAARFLPGQVVSLGEIGLKHRLVSGPLPPSASGGLQDATRENFPDNTIQSGVVAAVSADHPMQPTGTLSQPNKRVQSFEQQMTLLTGDGDNLQQALRDQDRRQGNERLMTEGEIAARLCAERQAWAEALAQLSARVELLERGRERLEARLRRQSEIAAALETELAAVRSPQAAPIPAADSLPQADVCLATRSNGRAFQSERTGGANLANETATAVTRPDLQSNALADQVEPSDPLLGQLIQYQARESAFDRRRRFVRASIISVTALAAAAGLITLIVYSDALVDRFVGGNRSSSSQAPVVDLSDSAAPWLLDDETELDAATPVSADLVSKHRPASPPVREPGPQAKQVLELNTEK